MYSAVCTNQAGIRRQLAPLWFHRRAHLPRGATAHPIPCFPFALRHPRSGLNRQAHTLEERRANLPSEAAPSSGYHRHSVRPAYRLPRQRRQLTALHDRRAATLH